MFSLVRPDIALVAEGVLYLLDVLSFLFVLILAHLYFVRRALRAEALDEHLFRFLGQAAIFLALVIATLAICHIAANRLDVLAASLLLAIGSVLAIVFYFAVMRAHIRIDDNRARYAMMVWAALDALSIVALFFLWLARDKIAFDTQATISLDVLAQVAGIVVTATGIVFTYVMKSEQTNRTANQQIYQTLELQSVELFRFECDHRDLVEALWYAEPREPQNVADAVQEYRLKQYICQMLNLFEMAYRFRVQGIMGDDVFGSWVIWMWELCSTSVFRHFWADPNGLPANHVKDFRALMQMGVDLHDEALGDDARRAEFFKMVADELGCDVVEGWFINAPRRRYVARQA